MPEKNNLDTCICFTQLQGKSNCVLEYGPDVGISFWSERAGPMGKPGEENQLTPFTESLPRISLGQESHIPPWQRLPQK